MPLHTDLPVLSFGKRKDLREWLISNHANSAGIWVRLYKKNSGVQSISFEDLLDEGLCFGWSESLRHKNDELSYLQKFTPRKTKGTNSPRNISHIKNLIEEKLMTQSGLDVLSKKDLEGLCL